MDRRCRGQSRSGGQTRSGALCRKPLPARFLRQRPWFLCPRHLSGSCRVFSVCIPSSSMLSRSSCARKRSSQILKMSYPTVSWRVVPANFTAIFSTSARETFCTRKLLASPPARSMLKIRATREPHSHSVWAPKHTGFRLGWPRFDQRLCA